MIPLVDARESHELNDCLLSTLREGVNQARMFKHAALQKLPKLVARKEREKTPDI